MEERIIKDINNLLAQLFQKMKEAGYEWDDEKRELKKIEQSIEIPFGAKDSELQEASYYIPEGFHAEIDGNRVVIKKGEQKPAWSEEDEAMLQAYLHTLQANSITGKVDTIMTIWLKSLKERILPQPKQEWGEKDESHLIHCVRLINNAEGCSISEQENAIDWLKSLKDRVQPQNKWKPADGDDLPEFEREVIVLHQPSNLDLEKTEYCVSFAHRPNPKGWYGKSMLTGKIDNYTPKTYGAGGWNIPNVMWWLDCDFPDVKNQSK